MKFFCYDYIEDMVIFTTLAKIFYLIFLQNKCTCSWTWQDFYPAKISAMWYFPPNAEQSSCILRIEEIQYLCNVEKIGEPGDEFYCQNNDH